MKDTAIPRGRYFHISRSGGLGPDIKFRGKIWGKVQSSSPNIRKIWEVLLPQDVKVGEASQFWGHLGLYLKFKWQNLGYLSPTFLEAKFGAPTRISEANFGAKPPDLLILKYPPWAAISD